MQTVRIRPTGLKGLTVTVQNVQGRSLPPSKIMDNLAALLGAKWFHCDSQTLPDRTVIYYRKR